MDFTSVKTIRGSLTNDLTLLGATRPQFSVKGNVIMLQHQSVTTFINIDVCVGHFSSMIKVHGFSAQLMFPLVGKPRHWCAVNIFDDIRA